MIDRNSDSYKLGVAEHKIERLRAALQVAAADLVGCCKNPEDPFVAASLRRIADACGPLPAGETTT